MGHHRRRSADLGRRRRGVEPSAEHSAYSRRAYPCDRADARGDLKMNRYHRLRRLALPTCWSMRARGRDGTGR